LRAVVEGDLDADADLDTVFVGDAVGDALPAAADGVLIALSV
jgi:hypothetical protein